jgi:hypothetical protein
MIRPNLTHADIIVRLGQTWRLESWLFGENAYRLNTSEVQFLEPFKLHHQAGEPLGDFGYLIFRDCYPH